MRSLKIILYTDEKQRSLVKNNMGKIHFMKGLDGQKSPGKEYTLFNTINQQSPNTNKGEINWHTMI